MNYLLLLNVGINFDFKVLKRNYFKKKNEYISELDGNELVEKLEELYNAYITLSNEDLYENYKADNLSQYHIKNTMVNNEYSDDSLDSSMSDNSHSDDKLSQCSYLSDINDDFEFLNIDFLSKLLCNVSLEKAYNGGEVTWKVPEFIIDDDRITFNIPERCNNNTFINVNIDEKKYKLTIRIINHINYLVLNNNNLYTIVNVDYALFKKTPFFVIKYIDGNNYGFYCDFDIESNDIIKIPDLGLENGELYIKLNFKLVSQKKELNYGDIPVEKKNIINNKNYNFEYSIEPLENLFSKQIKSLNIKKIYHLDDMFIS